MPIDVPELYERALDLVDRLVCEIEELSKVEIPFALPEDLQKVWMEHQALVETLKTLPVEQRAALSATYREKLEDADPYDETGMASIQGPEVDGALIEKAETLFEDDRRARLLA